MTRPTQDILAEMKKMCDAATGGEWVANPIINSQTNYGHVYNMTPGKHGWIVGTDVGKNNALFIAQSRTALPRLIEALSVAIEALKNVEASSHGLIKSKINEATTEINRILNGINPPHK